MNSELLNIVADSKTPWLVGLTLVLVAGLSYRHWDVLIRCVETLVLRRRSVRQKVLCFVGKRTRKPLSGLRVLFAETAETQQPDENGALSVDENLWGTEISVFGPGSELLLVTTIKRSTRIQVVEIESSLAVP